jgi:hypothetical protein
LDDINNKPRFMEPGFVIDFAEYLDYSLIVNPTFLKSSLPRWSGNTW